MVGYLPTQKHGKWKGDLSILFPFSWKGQFKNRKIALNLFYLINMNGNEFLGLILPATDKAAIKKIAKRNNLSISDTARMLLKSGLSSLKEIGLKWS